MCAGYLFQQDKQYDVTYDTGDKAIQCGRHVDIFKFWLMWKAKVRLLHQYRTINLMGIDLVLPDRLLSPPPCREP